VARLIAAGYGDIRPADSQLFENIDPTGNRLTELADRAQMTHQSMGELVASLEQRGYVARAVDPRDARVRLVCLTAQGRQVQRRALAEIDAIEQEWFGSDATRASRILERALRRVEQLQRLA
jgi:DNA-binding MarR family transcriptional regulator